MSATSESAAGRDASPPTRCATRTRTDPARRRGRWEHQKWYLTRALTVFWSVVKYCESLMPYLSDQ